MARKIKTPSSLTFRPAASISLELTEDTDRGAESSVAPQGSQAFQEEEFLNQQKKEGVRKLKIEVDLLEAQVHKITGDNKLRKILSTLIFITVFGWLASVIYILCKVGTGTMCLSDKVLITLLTTTSINVIGLLVIVANYLFNKSKST